MISVMRAIFVVAAALHLLAPGVAAGEVYRWRDAEGNLHFADTPPEGPAEKLDWSAANEPPPTGGRATGEGRPIDCRRRLLADRSARSPLEFPAGNDPFRRSTGGDAQAIRASRI